MCWANFPGQWAIPIRSRNNVQHACRTPLACSTHVNMMAYTDITMLCLFSTLLLCLLAFLQPATALTNLALECGPDWHAWVLDGIACSEVERPCADLQGSVAAGAAQIALAPDFAWSESVDDSCACGSGAGRFAVSTAPSCATVQLDQRLIVGSARSLTQIDTPSRNLFYEEKGTASWSCYYGEGQCDIEGEYAFRLTVSVLQLTCAC